MNAWSFWPQWYIFNSWLYIIIYYIIVEMYHSGLKPSIYMLVSFQWLFTNSEYYLPSYPLKIYFPRHVSHFKLLHFPPPPPPPPPLFFFVGGIFSVGACTHKASEWIYATAGTKRFGALCQRFIPFHVHAHTIINKVIFSWSRCHQPWHTRFSFFLVQCACGDLNGHLDH